MHPRHPDHQIKGVWFIAGTDYLRSALPQSRWQALVEAVPEPYRPILEAPLTSEWYPEDAAAHFLNAWLQVAAKGDRRRFQQMVAEGSEQGVGRFFRAIARLASPRFVIKQTPTIFKHQRRGPARVEVQDEGERMVVQYRAFPFLADPIYPLTFTAQLGALLHATTGHRPVARVLHHTDSTMDVEVPLP
ncbi:MAG: hypothetical protein ACODAU_08420 [Myxococcota bacterium]